MANFERGQGGTITIGATQICVTKWTLKRNHTNIDTTTTCSAGWDENFPVSRGWSVDAEFPYAGTKVDALFNAMYTAAVPVPITVALVTSGGSTYSGSCLMEGYSLENAAKDVVRVTINLKGTGALT